MDHLDDGDLDENQLQACFLLHQGAPRASKCGSQSPRRKAGKKENTSDVKPENDSAGLPSVLGEPPSYGLLRWQAFNAVWGRIQKLVEDIVEGEYHETFVAVQQWICNRQFSDAQLSVYHSARLVSNGSIDPCLAASWPVDSASWGKQLHTALVFLGGINPSDHWRTFNALALHLKAHNCHVAHLTSVDFLFKAGVSGPVRSLFRQLINIDPETTDMEILAAWHKEAENQGLPIAIIIEGPESCDAKILSEFLVLLSEWIAELPLVLIMGMSTAEDAIRRLLPASTLARLHLWRFTLTEPRKLLELIIRAILIESFCAFELSHEVALFLCFYFEGHDHSVTSVMRSLKIACVEHFWKEPMSFLCNSLLTANSKENLEEQCAGLPDVLLSHVNSFPSLKGNPVLGGIDTLSSERMASSLWQLRPQKRMWGIVFQCLSALGKYAGFSFWDMLCAVLQWVTKRSTAHDTDEKLGPLEKVVSRLRDMTGSSLRSTLEEWQKATVYDKELNAEVSQILLEMSNSTPGEANRLAATSLPVKSQSLDGGGVKTDASHSLKPCVLSRSALRRIGQQRTPGISQVGEVTVNKRAEDLLRRVLREHLKPPESRPFHEIFCFKDVHVLKQALAGETRRKVHMDLLNSQKALKCDCCPADGDLSSSLHDTTLAYILSQEYGDLVRVHNWYQAFAATCDPKVQVAGDAEQGDSLTPRKGRSRKSMDLPLDGEGSVKKKRGRPRKSLDTCLENGTEEKQPEVLVENRVQEENAAIQARFTRAATELQIVGLVQMPKKGNSETVRRICI
ncbi:hypothetical protein R1sor_007182 [Riccia sorocarpa]|uniref:Origin recognition complex subunit 3 n=1 Tax=Riccia sorocarpa TaxID=122646 RepID=A0ABD3HRY4_9MARC